MNIALVICYQGHLFDGWQSNKQNKSIEKALEDALKALYGKSIQLDAASRTDKGVHALKQVVLFKCDDLKIPLSKLPSAINSKLPKEIRVLLAIEVEKSFHPSLSCISKTYIYKIYNSPVHSPFLENSHWHIHQDLDLDLIKQASCNLVGKKDFSNFCTEKNHHLKDGICELYSIDVDKKDKEITIKLHGDRFLYKMCRTLVGTLVQIGLEKLSPFCIEESFKEKKRELLGMTAPAYGLYLQNLYYPNNQEIAKFTQN
jgi:tRNA pseudouridine38-40 synthase